MEDSEKWDTDDGARRFYDDLTAIDWIFEYTKEKLRLKKLAAQGGLYGYLASVFDSSQIWIVLICTGIAAGSLAACIDIVANWLGDLKDGYCQETFYLSRTFCCWGLDGMDPPRRNVQSQADTKPQHLKPAINGFLGVQLYT